MLTFPIAADVFRGRVVVASFRDPERQFSGLRTGPEEGNGHLLYVYPVDGGARVYSGGEGLFLPDTDAREAYGMLAAHVEALTAWERRLQELVFGEHTLKDIIDASVPVFQNAIMITDEANRIQAMSDHGPGEVSAEWDYMLQNRSTELQLVLDIFRSEPFRSHAFTDMTQPFYFVPPGLRVGGINCRIPAPDRRSMLGTALILTDITPVSEGMLQTARIFSDAVCRWVRLHHRELPMASASAVFSETLSGELLTEDRSLLLHTALLSGNDSYRILCVYELPRLMMDTCTQNIEATLKNAVCCQNGGMIYVLISNGEYVHKTEQVIGIVGGTGARVGHSHRFNDLHRLGEFAQQARIAAAFGKGAVCPLNSESVMRFTAEKMQRTPLRAGVAHPALLALEEYDRAHGTEFCRTLYVYLRHERRIADSLPALNIHRNTLIYRLKRMETLLEADLDDPAEREHLLLSFRILDMTPDPA